MSLVKVILLGAALVSGLGIVMVHGNSAQKPAAKQPTTASGKEMFLDYCASCHGKDGKGSGPVAIALKIPPPDLTTLSRRNEGRYPAGYVSAVLKFGKSFASHGSEEMPIWGTRFKTLDTARDPTGQHHIDDVVAYIESLQAK